VTASSRPHRSLSGTAVVTRAWGAGSEEGLALRQLAAALGHAGPVSVARLGPTKAPARPDGAFVVHGLESEPPDSTRRALLLALFANDTSPRRPLPGPARAWLRELDGKPAEGLGDWLGARRPALVLTGGIDEASCDVTLNWADRHGAEVVQAPLTTPEVLATGAYDRRLGRAQRALAPSLAEAKAVAAGRGDADPDAAFSGVVLAINPLAWHSSPHGIEARDYVLFLCALPSDEPGSDERAWALAERCHATLADTFGRLVTVRSGADRLVVAQGERTTAVRPPSGRMDFWRLLVRASVLVDLRPPGYLGREVLEAMLAGVAVVVPEDAPVAAAVEAANGGLWWSTPNELEAVVAELCPLASGRVNPLARTLGEQGAAFAKQWCGSPGDFVARVLHACGVAR